MHSDDEKCCNRGRRKKGREKTKIKKQKRKRVRKSGIAWLAVSGWVLKLKSFGGIRERDVERARGCG